MFNGDLTNKNKGKKHYSQTLLQIVLMDLVGTSLRLSAE